MASSEYAAYSPSVIFRDDVGGTGGTDFIATNINGLRDDLGTYVENHIQGTNNRHASNDILDYYTDSVPTTRINLLETTAYANAAPDAQHLYTQWARNDMFAKLWKDYIGGAGANLTARISDYNTLTGGNGSLTTLWNLTHGGSPTFGSVTGVAPNSGAFGGLFKAASTDPNAQNVFGVTNNAGGTYYFLVTAPDVATPIPAIVQARGTFVAIATDNTKAAIQARSSDNTAGRKVFSAQTFAATEGAYITNDGAALFGATAQFGGGIQHNGLATGSAPATAASKGVIFYDLTLNKWRASQNNGAYVDMIGNAAAAGAQGAIQFAGAGNAFAGDVATFAWDNTNKRMGLGNQLPATQLDMTGALTQRGMTLPGVSTAGQGIMAFDAAANVFKVSMNQGAFTPILVGNNGGAQTMLATAFTLTGSMNVLGAFQHGAGGANYGSVNTAGLAAGFGLADRNNSGNATVLYQNLGIVKLNTTNSGGLDLWAMDATVGTVTSKSLAATASGTGVVPGQFSTILAQNTDAFVIDATATATGGMKQAFDKYGHSYKTGGAPVLSSTNAGTSGSVTISGNDEEGVITVNTGSGAVPSASALIATVTFAQPWASTPKIIALVAQGANAQGLAAAALPQQGTTTGTAFNLISGVSAMAISTTYKFLYKVIL